jgi:hypothetical protein
MGRKNLCVYARGPPREGRKHPLSTRRSRTRAEPPTVRLASTSLAEMSELVQVANVPYGSATGLSFCPAMQAKCQCVD